LPADGQNARRYMLKFIEYISRKRKLIITLLIIAGVISVMAFSTHGLITRIGLEIDNSNYRDLIGQEISVSDSLNKRIRLLQTDLTEIERIARENYGMIKPGDKVYFVKDTDSVAVKPEDGD